MTMPTKREYALFEITPEIEHFAQLCEDNNAIDKELYTKYEVKRGLRDVNGKGVLAGLTNISDVCATQDRRWQGKSRVQATYTTVATILRIWYRDF